MYEAPVSFLDSDRGHPLLLEYLRHIFILCDDTLKGRLSKCGNRPSFFLLKISEDGNIFTLSYNHQNEKRNFININTKRIGLKFYLNTIINILFLLFTDMYSKSIL